MGLPDDVMPGAQRSKATTDRWSVGIIGAGLAARSLHLPVLAGLSDRFLVQRVWDINRDAAKAFEELSAAEASVSLQELLSGESLDVVVVSSPAHLHAEHAIAAMRAGARVVLIEKPLCATADEARAISEVSQETGSAIIVGAMHLYDSGWTFLKTKVDSVDAPPRSIQLRIILPPNGRFEQWSTETVSAPPAASPLAGMAPSALINLLITGLGIHDLPLLRRLLPEGAKPVVASARLLSPFGFAVDLVAGNTTVEILAFLNRHWLPDWSLIVTGSDWQGRVDFTPSFVPAGSASAWFARDGSVTHQSPRDGNGYLGEWLEIAAILAGERPPPDLSAFKADMLFALDIAAQAEASLATGEAR